MNSEASSGAGAAAWPVLPDRFPAGDYELQFIDGSDPQFVAAVEATVAPEERAETFHYFTRLPLPLGPFIAADATRRVYALVGKNSSPVGCTSLYDCSEARRRVTLGFTWISPNRRGSGANAALKRGMFDELSDAGVREVWFRADVLNAASRRSLEKAGAQFSHIEAAPRVYPDRVSASVYYFKRL
ncbi:GNAT family N-acetyltransferase [Corynebacterium heidelbergense]|uniref:N-acetyltransferase domain-containing protein n=1 Tax=Corynebacterium heidelbergense TaxID=2055947 RepID=A0A364VC34_9CORY|nr:GNAT family N-acetyltransferase [Corynebacterium heidelbergense]RAV34215.1 hypothetical protein CWC39_04475 [Corynebacterium heidelbergense]WCZ35818.1 hypothetical protein CHEID_01200 [Corynebacterium heidelbergense]